MVVAYVYTSNNFPITLVDHDLVLVELGSEITEGRIHLVYMPDGSLTIKRIYECPNEDAYFLTDESAHCDIIQEPDVRGLVTGFVRMLDGNPLPVSLFENVNADDNE